MFSAIEASFTDLAHSLPLEAFVFIASFIEEVIAPIPSAGVLLVTGSLALIQERPLLALIPLTLIAALGKTIGALIVYIFSEKFGGLMINKFGRFFGICPADMENLRSKITGSKKDFFILTLLRVLPVVPSAIISIGSGFLKIPLRFFIFSTIIGSIIRDGFFIYVGYTGTNLLHSLVTNSTNIESIVQAVILMGVLFTFTYLYLKRKRLPI